MEKISGILPPSARTRSADIADAQPARPGAPSLGRPMGKNSLGDRITLSKMAEQLRQNGDFGIPDTPTTYKNTSENAKLKVIEDLNRKFFSRPDREEGAGTLSEETVNRFDSARDFSDALPAEQEPAPSRSHALQEN